MTATLTARPADITQRRDSLLALVIHAQIYPITTGHAQALYDQTPWSGIGRNATRRDLRDLARRGQLIPIAVDGRRAYLVNPVVITGHPVNPRQAQLALIQAIADQGGEWTPGRAKVALRRAFGTNVYRSVAHRHLDELHRTGLLELHSEQPGHCFYTSLMEGGAA
ncbi:hypothetical protein AB0C77_06820 [Streptomyces sp. NPDC048629]|uniref:hypothetical protein n=1 Tax=Streptomyces sp. NPDC048629 TaxID=3154824 RepID=UPI00341F2D27